MGTRPPWKVLRKRATTGAPKWRIGTLHGRHPGTEADLDAARSVGGAAALAGHPAGPAGARRPQRVWGRPSSPQLLAARHLPKPGPVPSMERVSGVSSWSRTGLDSMRPHGCSAAPAREVLRLPDWHQPRRQEHCAAARGPPLVDARRPLGFFGRQRPYTDLRWYPSSSTDRSISFLRYSRPAPWWRRHSFASISCRIPEPVDSAIRALANGLLAQRLPQTRCSTSYPATNILAHIAGCSGVHCSCQQRLKVASFDGARDSS